jgi:hypothetical protein
MIFISISLFLYIFFIICVIKTIKKIVCNDMYDIIQKRIKEAAIFESNLLEHKKKHMEEKRIVLHNILIESECIKNILTSSSVVLIDSCSNSNKESDESRESDEFNNKYDQKVFSEDELVNKSKLFYISFQNILNNKIRNGSL